MLVRRQNPTLAIGIEPSIQCELSLSSDSIVTFHLTCEHDFTEFHLGGEDLGVAQQL